MLDVLSESARILPVDAIGLLAGSLVALSSIPKVLQRLKAVRGGTSAFDNADLWRDGVQAVGNALWVIVGISLGLISMTLFCATQALLMASLIYLNLQSSRTQRGAFGASQLKERRESWALSPDATPFRGAPR